MSFSIVEFLSENLVEVVPTNWVLDSKRCWYPSVSGPKQAKLMRDPNSQPDFVNGKIYAAKVIKTYSNYTKARENLNKAQDTSSLETPSESELRKSRKERKRKMVEYPGENDCLTFTPKPKFIEPVFTSNLFSSDDDNSDTASVSLFDIPAMQKPPGIVNADINLNEQIDEIEPTEGNFRSVNVAHLMDHDRRMETIEENHRSVNVAHLMDSDRMETIPENRQCCAASSNEQILAALKKMETENHKFQEAVLSRLIRVETEVNEIRRILNSHSQSGDVFKTVNTADVPALPLNDMPGLQEMEKWLALPSNVELLTHHLSSVGGASIKDTTRRILGKVFGKTLSVTMNWTGKNGKHALQKTMIAKVIIGSTRLSHSNESVTEKAVEEIIKSWFRFSKDREGGREKRRQELPSFNIMP